VLDVVNSGPRVDPAVAARLIEPFERGGRTGTHGAGLGLSIVRSVAEAHGGRLALSPRAEGGLSVRVSLPAA
jgi:signal transduction histidine kinase